MSAYDSNDIFRMQQDAVRRVREMQRRAQSNLARGPQPPRDEPVRVPPPEPISEPDLPPETAPETNKPSAGARSSLPRSQNDSVLLLSLILLLADSGQDKMLLLALLYILL